MHEDFDNRKIETPPEEEPAYKQATNAIDAQLSKEVIIFHQIARLTEAVEEQNRLQRIQMQREKNRYQWGAVKTTIKYGFAAAVLTAAVSAVKNANEAAPVFRNDPAMDPLYQSPHAIPGDGWETMPKRALESGNPFAPPLQREPFQWMEEQGEIDIELEQTSLDNLNKGLSYDF